MSANEKPLLLLVDGHALLHRAFHAVPPLTVPHTGEPIGAVYGFALIFLKVLNDYKPTHVAVALDRPTPTFRHEEFVEYKANRVKAPDELVNQFRRMRQVVEAFGIPIYEVDGYEADDVLGALCLQAKEAGIETLVVTGDTDALQLVAPGVKVLLPHRGFRETETYDEEAVERRYGLKPTQIADFKALKGDPSDNIPGVPGVGEKTATRLLQQFGSVEGLYQRLDEVTPPKLRETLKENEHAARLGKRLATIRTDVPIELDLSAPDGCEFRSYDRSRVLDLLRELEFSSLLDKLPEVRAEGPTTVAEALQPSGRPLYRIVNTHEEFAHLVSRLGAAKSFALNTETDHPDAMRAVPVGVTLSLVPGEVFYVPIGHLAPEASLPEVTGGEHLSWNEEAGPTAQLSPAEVLERLRPVLENTLVGKVGHNGKYDMVVLGEHGAELRNLAFDTAIAAYLLGDKALELQPLAFNRLGLELTPINALIGRGKKRLTMAQVAIPTAAAYSCSNLDAVQRLRGLFEEELRRQGLWRLFTEVEMPLVAVLARMERNGVALDTAFLRKMSWRLGEQLKAIEQETYAAVGHDFNINSPHQLGVVLFDELRLPRARRTKNGFSTEAAVLEKLRGTHPVIELLLEYRQLAKLKSTYIDALPALINPRTGRVHTNFNQTVTATGRLSSSEPNLQNIPIRTELGRQVRRAFIAGDEKEDYLLLTADYSQIELRILAHLSRDRRLIEAFLKDKDIHAATAADIFNVPLDQVTYDMRRVAKTVNFAVTYGQSDFGLSEVLGISRQEAARFISAYFQKYPGVRQYLDTIKRQARELGYVQTMLGRRRYIPEINSPNATVRLAAERMAINMPIQGTAADIIKLAMVQLHWEMERRKLRSKMILQVHDELVFEVPREELDEMKELAQDKMSSALPLSVPLKVDLKTGKNWGETENFA